MVNLSDVSLQHDQYQAELIVGTSGELNPSLTASVAARLYAVGNRHLGLLAALT